MPPMAFRITDNMPSPPSAMGIISVSIFGLVCWIAICAACPASSDVRLPLNESMAIRIFIVQGNKVNVEVKV